MGNVDKLPFFSGSIMAIVTGFISYIDGSKNQDIYIRMAIAMVVFFILGTIIKHTLISIQKEIEKKKEQELIELKKQEELMAAQVEEELGKELEKTNANGQSINLVADDFDEEFSPLTVSRVIASKTNER